MVEMTEDKWLDLLDQEPTEESYKMLLILADWLEEKEDPAYGLFRYLCGKILKTGNDLITGPYIWGTDFVWLRENYYHSEFRHSLPRKVEARCPDHYDTRKEAWQVAMKAWREVYPNGEYVE